LIYKSLDELVFAMQEKEKQIPIDRAELYKTVHIRSDGSPINPDAAEKIVSHNLDLNVRILIQNIILCCILSEANGGDWTE
jgi:hypothetical protein